ncbi:MAG: hypothetical protein WBQ44_04680 [Rhodococcus sp. (in: high G+C Gram-positive bacteria)]
MSPSSLSLDAMSLPERVEHLRRRMASVPARGGETRSMELPGSEGHAASVGAPATGTSGTGASAVDSPDVSVPDSAVAEAVPRAPSKSVLAVPDPLAALLPHGGLARGSVTAVSGAGSLLLGMVAATTAAGGYVAVVGQPRFGLLAAAEMGADLERLAIVPDPGEDPVEVAAILLDGLDLVVLGLGGRSVPPSRARAVVARARSKGATLLVTDGHWDGVDLRLDASVRSVDGVGTGEQSGRGRLRSLRLDVRAQGRAMRPRSTCIDLRSVSGRIQWVPAPLATNSSDRGADRMAVLA